MGIKETTAHMKKLLSEIMHDLEKAQDGNKTASQRVRTNSIKFSKVSKTYRKESVAQEKGAKGKAKKTAAKKAPAKKTAAKKAAKSSKKSR